MTECTSIQARLLSLQDRDYRTFQCRLMPTVDPSSVIGVRTPALRKMAAELAGTKEAEAFLSDLPHRYYEANNLHAFLVEKIRDVEECLAALDTFLPYVNNWATCDSMSPPVLKKYPKRLLSAIRCWMEAPHVYTVRFGIGMLMRHFLDDRFDPAYSARVATVPTDEYYLHMMVSWYFATALAKQYDATLPYFTEYRLPRHTHNRAISKAIESYRVPQGHKDFLKTLRIKR
ncbi:MAG: DNA alkylation repair protein [Clostridia bacterium]|nr:DNA alkylation repair protein [Clostridia bacterium]MBQ8859651.1 DNA alkylation repair protein [Clostridia bacterium]